MSVNKNFANRLPGKRSLSVHFKMKTEPFTRKLIGISINKRDGGVMVTPQLQNWDRTSYSSLRVSLGDKLIPGPGDTNEGQPENKTKLHYHRSGMTSVQPERYSGGEGRKTVYLPSLDDIDAVQIFSITMRVPGLFPWSITPRQGDVLMIMDHPRVRSVLISGVVYDRSRVPDESIGGHKPDHPLSLATRARGTFLLDLSGYGANIILGLHSSFYLRNLPDFAPDFSLSSFNLADLRSQGAVAIYTGDKVPLVAVMDPIPTVHNIHNVSEIQVMSSNHQWKE